MGWGGRKGRPIFPITDFLHRMRKSGYNSTLPPWGRPACENLLPGLFLCPGFSSDVHLHPAHHLILTSRAVGTKMIRKIAQALNPISLGEPAPASNQRGLETSQGVQYHSCHSPDAAPEVTCSWRWNLAGLGAKAITAQSDLGGNLSWFCLSSRFIQIKSGPVQVYA